jgi:hypothetical protein
MRHTARTLRRAAVITIAVCSVISAVFLIWQLVTREQIGSLTNGHLIGMVALFVLPGATAAAWELDRRAALKVPMELDDEDEEPDLHGFAGRQESVHQHAAREELPGQRDEAGRVRRHRRPAETPGVRTRV